MAWGTKLRFWVSSFSPELQLRTKRPALRLFSPFLRGADRRSGLKIPIRRMLGDHKPIGRRMQT